jgi:hypothetical protein
MLMLLSLHLSLCTLLFQMRHIDLGLVHSTVRKLLLIRYREMCNILGKAVMAQYLIKQFRLAVNFQYSPELQAPANRIINLGFHHTFLLEHSI